MLLRRLWDAITLAVLCAGLWASVQFMVAMLAMFDPSRVPL